MLAMTRALGPQAPRPPHPAAQHALLDVLCACIAGKPCSCGDRIAAAFKASASIRRACLSRGRHERAGDPSFKEGDTPVVEAVRRPARASLF